MVEGSTFGSPMPEIVEVGRNGDNSIVDCGAEVWFSDLFSY